MEVSEAVQNFIDIYGGLAVFVGTFLTGEVTLLPSFALAAQGILQLKTVLFFGIAGTLCTDLFWYVFGRYFLTIFHRERWYAKSVHPFSLFLDRIIREKVFLALLFSKFFIGARIIMIIYFSLKKIPLRIFIPLDAVGIFLYVTVLSIIGVLIGKGLNLLPIYHTSTKLIALATLVFLIIFLARTLIKRKVKREASLYESTNI